MEKSFIFEHVSDNQVSVIAQLTADYYTIGRDDEEANIVVAHSPISRRHAIISCCGSLWLYQDVGSTNGSWIRGTQLIPHKWYLLRCGENLQIADLNFNISEVSSDGEKIPPQGYRSLIVLKNDIFVSEIQVADYGRCLTIGGTASDLELEGDLFEQPSLVIEKKGDGYVLYSVAREFPLSLNGEEIKDVVTLKDNDEIKLGNYTIFFSDPDIQLKIGDKPITSVSQISANLKDWSESSEADWNVEALGNKPVLFGQEVDENSTEGTFSIDVNVVSRRQVTPVGEDPELSSLEDKVILIIGIILVIALIAVVVLWFTL